ncbi:helix-turn-helix transcriptional regulator [Microbulbifer aggregans]|uniref:helix-turn-helix transcriptional regulator n=1 Tax=Microbulbifer aggregans TaxID=1769779 RepID=UPI001CFEB595|nr:AraC family transcriptional regulator [Microbulbifer aggregans]
MTMENNGMRTSPAPLTVNNRGKNSFLHHAVKVEEIARRPGVSLRLADPALAPDSVMMRGQFQLQEFGTGLLLRSGDSHEDCAYAASATLAAGLSCIIFLRGDIELRVGDQSHRFTVHPDTGIEILSVHTSAAQPFQRISRCAQPVRYLAITATPEWLQQRFGHSDEPTLRITAERLPRRLRVLAWEIFRLQETASTANTLQLEAKVIEVLANSWDSIGSAGSELSALSLPAETTPREVQSFQRARDTIRQNLSNPLSVNQIAQAAGVSASGLQRLFHKFEGVSVIEFTRQLRLQLALDALRSHSVSVQEASALAGYSSAANFATAFKKLFGFSPREAISRSEC